jgi:hypothetical protein
VTLGRKASETNDAGLSFWWQKQNLFSPGQRQKLAKTGKKR